MDRQTELIDDRRVHRRQAVMEDKEGIWGRGGRGQGSRSWGRVGTGRSQGQLPRHAAVSSRGTRSLEESCAWSTALLPSSWSPSQCWVKFPTLSSCTGHINYVASPGRKLLGSPENRAWGKSRHATTLLRNTPQKNSIVRVRGQHRKRGHERGMEQLPASGRATDASISQHVLREAG